MFSLERTIGRGVTRNTNNLLGKYRKVIAFILAIPSKSVG